MQLITNAYTAEMLDLSATILMLDLARQLLSQNINPLYFNPYFFCGGCASYSRARQLPRTLRSFAPVGALRLNDA